MNCAENEVGELQVENSTLKGLNVRTDIEYSRNRKTFSELSIEWQGIREKVVRVVQTNIRRLAFL